MGRKLQCRRAFERRGGGVVVAERLKKERGGTLEATPRGLYNGLDERRWRMCVRDVGAILCESV